MTTSIADDSSSAPTIPLLVLLSWSVAASVVATIHSETSHGHAAVGFAATVATLLAISYLYCRLAGRRTGLSHALLVGAVWLALSITVEMIVTIRLGHEWFALLGPPDNQVLRVFCLLVWMFGPAMFARRNQRLSGL